MQDHEKAMLAYIKLATLSQEKQQLLGRDKFLILAGAAACRAGWPEVAERCCQLVLKHNPSHMLKNYDTFIDAMLDDNFSPFLKRLERFCPYEKAEHLLHELDAEFQVPEAEKSLSSGRYALQQLRGSEFD